MKKHLLSILFSALSLLHWAQFFAPEAIVLSSPTTGRGVSFDVDGDGDLDVVQTDLFGPGFICVYYRNGSDFDEVRYLPILGASSSFQLIKGYADIDHDGDDDLVNSFNNQVKRCMNNVIGFSSAQFLNITALNSITCLGWDDADGDVELAEGISTIFDLNGAGSKTVLLEVSNPVCSIITEQTIEILPVPEILSLGEDVELCGEEVMLEVSGNGFAEWFLE